MLWEDNFKKQLPGTIKSNIRGLKKALSTKNPEDVRIFQVKNLLRLTISCSE
jgi:hypothetical protein